MVSLGTTLETSGRVQCSFQAQVTMQKSQLSLEVENIPSQNFENACFLTVANKSKLYYGIPPELDLGVVIEEENEEEEDNI